MITIYSKLLEEGVDLQVTTTIIRDTITEVTVFHLWLHHATPIQTGQIIHLSKDNPDAVTAEVKEEGSAVGILTQEGISTLITIAVLAMETMKKVTVDIVGERAEVGIAVVVTVIEVRVETTNTSSMIINIGKRYT